MPDDLARLRLPEGVQQRFLATSMPTNKVGGFMEMMGL
jgi:hypothetical protein